MSLHNLYIEGICCCVRIYWWWTMLVWVPPEAHHEVRVPGQDGEIRWDREGSQERVQHQTSCHCVAPRARAQGRSGSQRKTEPGISSVRLLLSHGQPSDLQQQEKLRSKEMQKLPNWTQWLCVMVRARYLGRALLAPTKAILPRWAGP